jgi:hypothetical protein
LKNRSLGSIYHPRNQKVWFHNIMSFPLDRLVTKKPITKHKKSTEDFIVISF